MLSLTSSLQNRSRDTAARFAHRASNAQAGAGTVSVRNCQHLPFLVLRYNSLRHFLNVKSRQIGSPTFFRAALGNRRPERRLTALKYYIFLPFSVRCTFAKSLRYNGYFNLIRCTARSDAESVEPACNENKRRGAHPRKRKPPEAGGRRGKSKFHMLRFGIYDLPT